MRNFYSMEDAPQGTEKQTQKKHGLCSSSCYLCLTDSHRTVWEVVFQIQKYCLLIAPRFAGFKQSPRWSLIVGGTLFTGGISTAGHALYLSRRKYLHGIPFTAAEILPTGFKWGMAAGWVICTYSPNDVSA